MAKIFPVLGIMFCSFFLYEFLSQFFLSHDEFKDSMFHTILSWIAVIALFCSAPVGLVLLWHDMRMEKIHYDRFRKERKPYDDMMERKYQEAVAEVKSLEASLQRYSPTQSTTRQMPNPDFIPIQHETHPAIAPSPDKDERIYFVTTFDGESLRIPESKYDTFKKRNAELCSKYTSQFGYIELPIWEHLEREVTGFLNQYSDGCNRESFLFLSVALIRSSIALRHHGATVIAIEKRILNKVTEMPKDKFSIYSTERLNEVLAKWTGELRLLKHSTSHQVAVKNCAKSTFTKACPRQTFTFSRKKALYSLFERFECFVIDLIQKESNA